MPESGEVFLGYFWHYLGGWGGMLAALGPGSTRESTADPHLLFFFFSILFHFPFYLDIAEIALCGG